MKRRTALLVGGATVATAAAGGGFALSNLADAKAYDDSVAASRANLAAVPELVDLIAHATLAANSHNTQPWRFRVRNAQVEILPDFTRRTPVGDPHDHHLFISPGCAAENLVIAGAGHGRPVSTTFSDQDGGSIICDVTVGATTDVGLATAITHRQSTRSEYDGRVLSTAVLTELAAAAQRPGVEMALVTGRADVDRLRDLVLAANSVQMADPAFMTELKSWLRFNPREAVSLGDGLFSAASGNPQLPSWIAGTAFDWFVTADGESNRYRRQIDSSAGIAVFFAERDDAEHWVRVGQAFERFALKATALGVKTAHVNQPVEVARFRSDLAALAGKPGGLPLLAVRFGYGAAMPFSLRRPVADVLA